MRTLLIYQTVAVKIFDNIDFANDSKFANERPTQYKRHTVYQPICRTK